MKLFLNNCRYQSHQFKHLYISKSYKLFNCLTTFPRSGRRSKLSPSDERKLGRMLRNSPGTTKSQTSHELETAEIPPSLSTAN